MKKFIAENIKNLRLKNGLTQNKLCEELKKYGCVMSRSTYTKYERGNNALPYDVLIAIIKYYNVTADFILGLKK